jgi:hypothetical protein
LYTADDYSQADGWHKADDYSQADDQSQAEYHCRKLFKLMVFICKNCGKPVMIN